MQWLPGSLSPQLGWVFWSQPHCRSPPQCSLLSSDPQSSPKTQRRGECRYPLRRENHGTSEGRFITMCINTSNIPSMSRWLCGWHLLIPDRCCTWWTKQSGHIKICVVCMKLKDSKHYEGQSKRTCALMHYMLQYELFQRSRTQTGPTAEIGHYRFCSQIKILISSSYIFLLFSLYKNAFKWGIKPFFKECFSIDVVLSHRCGFPCKICTLSEEKQQNKRNGYSAKIYATDRILKNSFH